MMLLYLYYFFGNNLGNVLLLDFFKWDIVFNQLRINVREGERLL